MVCMAPDSSKCKTGTPGLPDSWSRSNPSPGSTGLTLARSRHHSEQTFTTISVESTTGTADCRRTRAGCSRQCKKCLYTVCALELQEYKYSCCTPGSGELSCLDD